MDGWAARAAIVDGCQIFLRGLSEILRSNGFAVTERWVAANAPLPLNVLATESMLWRADIVLLDPEVVATAGLPDLSDSVAAAAPMLLLGDGDRPWQLAPYRESGVAGFVDRRTDIANLLAAVQAVMAGGSYWKPGHLDHDQPPAGHNNRALSPREAQVLRQIAQGLTHGQVARRLGISPHTVDTYIKRIRSKLDLGNKADLTRAAILGSLTAMPPGRPTSVTGSGDKPVRTVVPG